MGADANAGEPPAYMNDLEQLVKNKQRDLEQYSAAYGKMGG